MKHAPIVALALTAALVAGCGGGSSTRITDLEEELAATQDELDAAQAAQEEARKAEEAAEAARLEAARKADAAQEEEARKAEEAAEAARLEAARKADAAQEAVEEQLRQEQEARQEAEREAAELEEEAGHTADQLVQANARQVLAGLTAFLDGTGDIGNGDPAVTPRYRESASVDTAPDGVTNPDVTFSGITTGTSGNWFRTSFSNRAFKFTDRLDVYSDAESPGQVPFKESIYNDGDEDETVVPRYNPDGNGTTRVIDGEGDVVGSLKIVDDLLNAAASSFPRSGDAAKLFNLNDRGKYTIEERRRSLLESGEQDYLDPSTLVNDDDDATPYTGTYRNVDDHPLRYTYEVRGSLSGASGTYTCASESKMTSCSVLNQNNHFRFTGPWVFTPTAASSQVRVDDAEFMYFGWWARQDNLNGMWDFRTFHGPMVGNRATSIAQLTGTATYQGPAVGQYSFYQPLTSHSEYGEFSATATLTADFGDIANTGGTVRGTIDQFADHPDWTLTLKQGTIVGGAIPTGTDDAVSWQIEDEAVAAPDSGTWEAAFYSDLSAEARVGTVPNGMAGTFEAEYHHVGRIIGAFGAHKQP